MQDPKRQAWLYLVAGVVAIIAAAYFLSVDSAGGGGDFSILDWAILGMGVVATFRGVRMFLDLRKDAAKAASTPKVVLPKPKDPKPPTTGE
ncbi:MAG: hypothetical protein LCH96_07375 [Actinobacteria bacterium]|nr:hypothetical protein [Actinomycetota bacterium]